MYNILIKSLCFNSLCFTFYLQGILIFVLFILLPSKVCYSSKTDGSVLYYNMYIVQYVYNSDWLLVFVCVCTWMLVQMCVCMSLYICVYVIMCVLCVSLHEYLYVSVCET